MATIVFSAIGTAIGGPTGGAIGAAIGQQIDNRILFAPKPTHGPRLKDLAVQTSQYGTPIPAVFGRMRVAGTVIWATDLIESKTKTGAKGSPQTIQYSYRVSFAVALSSRPALRLGRVWADGKLLREDGGALSSGGTLRFHAGGADQMPDPLIAADVGAAQCPAFRGLAYAVVEDMPLADFGNRIPSLTFEVVADDGPVSLDTIARYGSDGRLTAPDTAPLTGYAAEGADLDAWLAPLIAAEGRVLSAAGAGFALLHPTQAPVTLPTDHVTHLNGARQEERGMTLTAAAAPMPPYSLRYYDAARDYQIAVQASIGGDQNLPVQSIDLPAVMSAATASALVHRIAFGRRTGAQTEERIVPEVWADALPLGALYQVAGETRLWQVVEREWLNGAVRLTARMFAPPPPLPTTGSSGSHIGSSVAAIGATHLLAIELPSIPGLSAGAFLTAAGAGAGWRGAMAYAEEDGVARPLGWIGKGTAMGRSVAALPAHHGLLTDPMGVVELDLLHADMDLPPAANATNAATPPLLLMDGEILSYADAVPLSATRWRLTGLTRALYNSAAPTAHPAGSMAVSLDAAIPHWPLPLTHAPLGGMLAFSAEGAEDDPPATASLTVQHSALRPPAPVHSRWWRDGANLYLSWTRRSRSSAPWADYLDTPLGEAMERYRVDAGAAYWEVGAPALTLPIAELPPATGGAHTLSIRHIGDTGASEPLTLTIPAAALA